MGPEQGPNDDDLGQILDDTLDQVPLNYAALKARGIDVEFGYRRRTPTGRISNFTRWLFITTSAWDWTSANSSIFTRASTMLRTVTRRWR